MDHRYWQNNFDSSSRVTQRQSGQPDVKQQGTSYIDFLRPKNRRYLEGTIRGNSFRPQFATSLACYISWAIFDNLKPF